MSRASLAIWQGLLLALSLCACTGAPEPVLIVQLCVRDNEGLSILRSELSSIAKMNHLTYVDGSESTGRNVELVTSDTLKRKDGVPYLNIQLNRRDGLGVGATNLGLPGHEVAVAFNTGDDPSEAERFSKDVVGRLSNFWRVTEVPAGEGAKPQGNCE